MATQKSPVKKTTARTKKAAAPRKRATTVRRTTTKSAAMQSFRVAKQSKPFFSLKPDIQTVYWTILAVCVLSLGLWVIDINNKVMRIYDQIDQDINIQDSLSVQSAKKR